MNKIRLAAVVAALGILSAPAFATHPNEVCHIALDVAALSKSAGVDAATAKIVFVFRGGISNMTDMDAPKPEVSARPADGPWAYKTDLHSNLYYRSLAAILVQSTTYKTEDGTPTWSVRVERPADADAKKGSSIVCEQYAD